MNNEKRIYTELTVMRVSKHKRALVSGKGFSPLAGHPVLPTIAIIFTTLIISSCAGFYLNLRTVSYTDEDFPSPKYKKIAVLGDFEDYFLVKSYEEAFSRTAYKEGMECLRATPLVPPTRQWTNEEIISRLKEQQVGALVVIGFSPEYQKLSEISGETKISARAADDIIFSETNGFEKYERAFVKCRVFDVESGRLVWIANLGDENGAILLATLKRDYNKSQLALKLILELQDDEIIRSTHPRRK